MSNVIDIGLAAKRHAKRNKSALKAVAKQKTLCANGHHKWQIDKAKQFDVKSGKLITVLRCQYCGKEKTQLR